MTALIVAALAPYLSSLTFDFVLDDRPIVRANEAIRGWGALFTLWTKPYWITATGEPSQGLYRPVFMVALSILWNTGLRFPIFFHLLAVVAHVAASVLVFPVLRRMMPSPAAAVGAFWFAVHPVHIEAVASIANSSEIFVAVATLSLVLVLLRADASTEPAAAIGWPTAVAAGLLFAAAVLSKESGVAAPALALLAVWGRRQPSESQSATWFLAVRAAWNRWWRVAASSAVVLVAVVAARMVVLRSLVSRESIAAEGLDALSAWQRTWAMLSLGPKIVGLLVWPGEQNPMYGPRAIAGNTGPNVLAVGFVVALACVAWGAWRMARRGDRRVACAVAWMLIAFAPASNLLVPTGQILAERTLYLASFGIAVLLGVAVHTGLTSIDALNAVRQRSIRFGATIAAAVLLFMVARSTHQRSQSWRDLGAVLAQAIKADAGDPRPHWHMARFRLTTGDTTAAIDAYDRAFALGADERDLPAEFAALLVKVGQPEKAAAITARFRK